MTAPGRMEAVALDAAGQVVARTPLDGTGKVVFDLPDDADLKLVRWAGEDGVAHDYLVPDTLPTADHPSNPGAPRGECPTCRRDLPLDVDADGARFVPLHGGWPPCHGSGMPA
jgi:hypothetical protein